MIPPLADVLESVGIDGLESILLSGLFGLEGINLRRPSRATTVERLAQVLRNSRIPQPIAGAIGTIPIVDRNSGRINFYRAGDISDLLSDVGPWLSGVDAGMGGVGGFGYGADGPIFNSFKSSLEQRSAETGASGTFCAALGQTLGIGVYLQSAGLGAVILGAVGGLAGGDVGGPVGAGLGAAAGAFVGGTAGWEIGEWINNAYDPGTVVTQACNGAFAAGGEDPPPDDDEEMPNPNSEETGLTPTDIQIAIGIARLNSAKRIDPAQTVMIGPNPVIVSSPAATRRLLVQPAYDPVVMQERPPIILGPRPGGPLTGRLANTLTGRTVSSVEVSSTPAVFSFTRVRPGEYVPEVGAPFP